MRRYQSGAAGGDDGADQWRDMFARLTEQITRDTDADVRAILQGVPAAPTGRPAVQDVKEQQPVAADVKNPAPDAEVERLRAEVASLTQELAMRNEEVAERSDELAARSNDLALCRAELASRNAELESCTARLALHSQELEQERTLRQELQSTLEDQLASLSGRKAEEGLEVQKLTQRFRSVLQLFAFACSWTMSESERNLEEHLRAVVNCDKLVVHDVSGKRLRNCAAEVQQAVKAGRMVQSSDGDIAVPIVESGGMQCRRVIQAGGLTDATGVEVTTAIAGVLGLRVAALASREKATTLSERCESLLAMISVIGNIESDRASVPSVLNWAQRELQLVLKCQSCRIWLIDEGNKELYSFEGPDDSEHREPSGTGIVGSVQVTKQHVMHNDTLTQHPLFHGSIDAPDGIDGMKCSAILCVPVMESTEGGEIHAVIQFVNKQGDAPFTPADHELALIFCHRLCSALRREKRAQESYSGLVKDLTESNRDRDVWRSRLNAYESLVKLFDADALELYPGNFTARVNDALMEALGADVVALGAVMPRNLLPFKLERVDKISQSGAFRLLCKQTIDTGAIASRENVRVAKLNQPLVLICGPMFDSLGRVTATVLVGVKSSKYGPHTISILSLFTTLCGAFLDRKHCQLSAAAARIPDVSGPDPPDNAFSSSYRAPTSDALEIDGIPRAPAPGPSGDLLWDEDMRESSHENSSRSSIADGIDGGDSLSDQAKPTGLELTSTGSGSVSAWREWMNSVDNPASDNEDESPLPSSAEARLKSFALLHAGSTTNVFQQPPSRPAESFSKGSNLERVPSGKVDTIGRSAPLPAPTLGRTVSVPPALERGNSQRGSTRVLKRQASETGIGTRLNAGSNPSSSTESSFRKRRLSKRFDIDEANAVLAALYIETDDIVDIVEFTGGDIEYVHPDANEVKDQVPDLPQNIVLPIQRHHQRIISLDRKMPFDFHIGRVSEASIEDLEPSPSSSPRAGGGDVLAFAPTKSRSPSASTTSSQRSRPSRHASATTRKKVFQAHSAHASVQHEDLAPHVHTGPLAPQASAPAVSTFTAGRKANDALASAEAEMEEFFRLTQILATPVEIPSASPDKPLTMVIAEGALLALSVVLSQTEEFQVRIGSEWFTWDAANDTAVLTKTPKRIAPMLLEHLSSPSLSSWKGEIHAFISPPKTFSRVEEAGFRGVASRLNMVLAYQSLIQDLKSTVENDSKENVRLQGQLQVSNSLIECMRTATLSSGLHMMFSNETCPLAKMVNAEFAQLWLFDQTCAELWTAVHDVVGGTLRTYRFPIDRPSILTQAAVSRVTVNYFEGDQNIHFSDDIDGGCSGTRYSTRPHSILCCAIGNDTEGVLGVVRVVNHLDPDCSGQRTRFTIADQRFLEAFCILLLDMVRAHRNAMKLQDRLDPAIKLSKSERQARQRMQVLLSAQIGRLAKITKQADNLGEGVKQCAALVAVLRTIADSDAHRVRSALESTGGLLWRRLGNFVYFAVFAYSQTCISHTDLRSLDSIPSDTGGVLYELVDHIGTANESVDEVIGVSDVKAALGFEPPSGRERWRVLGYPVVETNRSVGAVCILLKDPDEDLSASHDEQMLLFRGILSMWLSSHTQICRQKHELSNVNEDSGRVRSENDRLHSTLGRFRHGLSVAVDLLSGPDTELDSVVTNGLHQMVSSSIAITRRMDLLTDSNTFRLSNRNRPAIQELFPEINLGDAFVFAKSSCFLKNGTDSVIVVAARPHLDYKEDELEVMNAITVVYVAALECSDRCRKQIECDRLLQQATGELGEARARVSILQYCINASQGMYAAGTSACINDLVSEFARLKHCSLSRWIAGRQMSSQMQDVIMADTAEGCEGILDSPVRPQNLLSMPLPDGLGCIVLGSKPPPGFCDADMDDLKMFIKSISPIAALLSKKESTMDNLQNIQLSRDTMSSELEAARCDLDLTNAILDATCTKVSPLYSLHLSPSCDIESVVTDVILQFGLEADSVIVSSPWSRSAQTVAQLAASLPESAATTLTSALNNGEVACARAPLDNTPATLGSRSRRAVSVMWIPFELPPSGAMPACTVVIQLVRHGIQPAEFSDKERLAAAVFRSVVKSAFVAVQLQDVNRQLTTTVREAQTHSADLEETTSALFDFVDRVLSATAAVSTLESSLLFELGRTLSRLLGCEACTIFLCEFDGQNRRPIHLTYTVTGADRVKRDIPSESSIIGWVILTGNPYFAVDTATDPRFNPSYDASQTTNGPASSIMCVPLRFNQTVVGVVQALRSCQAPFSGSSVQQCTRLCDLLTAVCKHGGTPGPTPVPTTRQDAAGPIDVSDAVNGFKELQGLLLNTGNWRLDRSDRYVQMASDMFVCLHKLVQFEGCGLFVLDGDAMRYRLIHTDMELAPERHIDEIQFGSRQGLLGSVTSSARVLRITSAKSDPRFQSFPDQWMRSDLSTSLMLPLIDASSSVVSGVLQLCNYSSALMNASWRDNEVDIAQAVASLASMVAQFGRLNAMINDNLSRSNERLEAAREALQMSATEVKRVQGVVETSQHVDDFHGAVVGVSTLTPLFQAVQHYVRKVFSAHRSHLFLLDSERGDLFTSIVEEHGIGSQYTRLPMDKSVAGSVCSRSRPLLISQPWVTDSNLVRDSEFQGVRVGLSNLPWYTIQDWQSIMAAPVFDHSQHVVGVVEVCKRDALPDAKLTNDDVGRLELICSRISSVLYNCRQTHRLKGKLASVLDQLRSEMERHQRGRRRDGFEFDDDAPLPAGGLDGDQRLRSNKRGAPSQRAEMLDLAHLAELTQQLKAAVSERDQLKFEATKLYSALDDRDRQVQECQQRIATLEKDVRFAQHSFRTMILESLNDDNGGEEHAHELQTLQRELEQARGDNIQLAEAMQNLINEYAAHGSATIENAIAQARRLIADHMGHPS